MNIAIDGSLLSREMSGVELSILGLATGLACVPTDDRVLLYVGKKFHSEHLPAGCVKLRRAGGAASFRPRRVLWQQAMLPIYLRAEKVDVFHGPAYVLPVLSSVPSVVTVYDVIALTRPELCRRLNVMHYRRVVPQSVRKANVVIVPTHAVAAQVAKALGISGENIRVIPCGIDLRFKPASEAGKNELRNVLGLNGKFILFVGNLEPKKNLVSLVQAFFAAKMNRRLEHKLVLAGRPCWRHKPILRMISQLGIGDDVILPGHVPPEYLPALYSAADMFVFPSLIEGFGIPPLEAMACGTPAIVSRDPALLETTGGAAVDADATDLAALREAIEAVATRKDLRAELVEKGKARAAQFSWLRSAKATLEVYHEAFRMSQAPRNPGDHQQ